MNNNMAIRTSIAAVSLILLVTMAVAQPNDNQTEEEAREALSRAERAWLDAYVDNDVEAMDSIVADGFTITFRDGRIDTKADVIAKLKPGEARPAGDTVPRHYTEDRTIRVIGTTAILAGVYVYPRRDGTVSRSRYTDTWMYLDGRWRVVASHLSGYKEIDR